MTRRLPLKQRIFAGFLLVGLLATLIAVLSYASFRYVASNFHQFVTVSEHAQLSLALARQISEMQRKALIFTYEGHASAADQVEELYRNMRELTLDSRAASDNDIAAIREHLDSYMQAFAQLRRQRDLQHRLVYVDFRTSATRAENHLRAHMAGKAEQTDAMELLEDERCLSDLLMVEKDAMRYFDSLDPVYVRKARQSFTDVRKRMQTMIQHSHDTSARTEAEHAIAEAESYERIFLEAVQRTRGYLFLVNVVMSAEASEIIYHAQQMSAAVSTEMSTIEHGTLGMLERIGQITVAAIAISLLLVIALSVVVGRGITQPIVKLTHAFEALAGGSRQADIPIYGVKDEIGQLTHAATVFKEKNQQTEALLEQARLLTGELASKKQELERSNDELEQFVYTVSHDLKSPLVTSMGFIGIIRQLAAEGKTDEAIDKLDRVVGANERMGQLINDLLELSRVGRIDMDKKPVDLNELLADFRDQQAERLRLAGVDLHIEPGLPVIQANESRMLQLFENLLSNALKYGLPPENPHISIGVREEEDAWMVWFRDNGPGIPPEYHEKIFGLFYRLNPDIEGTGIGLAVAAKVMKFHQGSIQVESTPGEGATFWLRFEKHQEDAS